LPGDPASELRDMAAQLVHRGPDDSGVWWESSSGVGLGHRRLSIVDLSAEGHQPMRSASGRYVMAFNGEVYNFAEIRRKLEREGSLQAPLRGHSDTEVMLAAFDAWGIEAAIEHFVGMFAFAVWDTRDRVLRLVRDRLGVKPLYYGLAGRRLVFGSELKAFARLRDFDRDLDLTSVASYLRYGYIPAPRSVYRLASKVRPGCIVSFGEPSPNARREVRYWSAEAVAREGRARAMNCSDRDAVDELERLLLDSVRLRMVSDVPLGAFLSGGIDSSTVVALMQAQSSRPVKTFSIGNAEAAYDESAAAAAVARHLGTDHTAVTITPADARAIIPELPRIYDEPFADSSQIPTYLVSRIARRDVTVALSGDGGDELFGGYNRHVWGPRVWNALELTPRPGRLVGRRALLSFSPDEWDHLHAKLGPLAPRVRLAGQKAHKIARVLDARSSTELYQILCSEWDDYEKVLARKRDAEPLQTPDVGATELAESMMLWDLLGYLPDDIMTKVDRASMAVSLEAREPLLDHRLVEFASRLPLRLKVRKGRGKWALRQVLHRHVPPALVERPKMGFSVPMGQWLRGPLRPWVTDLLSPTELRAQGILDADEIARLWAEHESGRRDFGDRIWRVALFQAWLASAG